MDKYKISKIILYLFVIWAVINGLINRYISIVFLFGMVIAMIILLADFIEFVKNYRNKILIVFVIAHCLSTFFCILKFGTHEYVNLVVSYINVVLLETTDYQMIGKPEHSKEYIEDINSPYVRRRGSAYCYVIKNEGTIDDKMNVISNFLYTLEEYELSHGSTYSLHLKVGETRGVLYVTVEDYPQFTIVKFR